MAVVKDGADLNSVNINDAIGACPVDAIHYES
jgi:ferredoxin